MKVRHVHTPLLVLLVVSSLVAPSWAVSVPKLPVNPTGNDWTKYDHDAAGTGYTNEALINPADAALLKPKKTWAPVRGNVISTQPLVANNLVYWSSWDGIQHASTFAGADVWTRDIGRTLIACADATGPASTGTIVTTQIGSSTSVLYVAAGGTSASGGGVASVDAFDALTGALLWKRSLGAATDYFMWSSPVYYGGNIYVGLSSTCESNRQAKIVKLNGVTGGISGIFKIVPDGCLGGSVWGSPSIDTSDGSLYVATGNPDACSVPEPYTEAVLKIRTADMTLLGSWQVPQSERFGDDDFGSTPTLFAGTVTPTGAKRKLVGVVNKNGTYYVFDRANISAGPVARLKTALPPNQCPDCDEGEVVSVSPSAWDGVNLYVAGITITIKGKTYPGNVAAFNPNDLSLALWRTGLSMGHVLASVTAAPGLVVVGAGATIVVMSSTTGTILFKGLQPNSGIFFGAPTISHGVLYEGDTAGHLYAYSVLGK